MARIAAMGRTPLSHRSSRAHPSPEHAPVRTGRAELPRPPGQLSHRQQEGKEHDGVQRLRENQAVVHGLGRTCNPEQICPRPRCQAEPPAAQQKQQAAGTHTQHHVQPLGQHRGRAKQADKPAQKIGVAEDMWKQGQIAAAPDDLPARQGVCVVPEYQVIPRQGHLYQKHPDRLDGQAKQ